MQRGLHVLTEKLMAHNVAQCKVMSRMAAELKDKDGNPLHLATGHQRHYNIKYDNAVNLIRWGLIGQIHHIRAQWHRSNVPGADSWSMPIPGGEKLPDGKIFDRIAKDIAYRENLLKTAVEPTEVERLKQEIALFKAWDRDKTVDPSKFGYQDFKIGNRQFSAMEELHRWRLFDRTGAGLMAELGSHQLDAVSIFLSSLRNDKKKTHPLSVHAVGGRHIMPNDREVEDHVYCMFEFPGLSTRHRSMSVTTTASKIIQRRTKAFQALSRTRTRKWWSPTHRSTATASAVGAKSCWVAKAH